MLSSFMQKTGRNLRTFSQKRPLLLFYIILITISLFYFYHLVLFSPPQSIHRWRQADCLSMTLNYYQHGMNFFKPEVHHLISDNMNSGYAAGEAPLLYYFVALLYKIFGPHESIYRICNTLIFFIGLGALFKIARRFLNDFIISASVPLLIFVSPVAAYYANNFLSDSTALALVFIGWLQFIRFTDTGTHRYFIGAVVLFSLAGLLKITMAISLIALGCLVVHNIFFSYPRDKKPFFKRTIKTLLPVITGLLLIMSWTFYAIWFNGHHLSNGFLTTILPWWHLNQADRHEITRMIIEDNRPIYYNDGVLYLLLLAVVILAIYGRRIPQYLNLITGLLVAGGITFVNLFYMQFVYHDYYILVLLAPLAFILLSSLLALKEALPKVASSWLFKSVLLVLMTFSVVYARKEMQMRYFGTKRETPVYEPLFTIKPYLKLIGVKPEDRVISMPDFTNSYTLYLMNQQGYRIWEIDSNTTDTICRMIKMGADYLVIHDSTYLDEPEIKFFTRDLAGSYNDIKIFKLTSCPEKDPRLQKQRR